MLRLCLQLISADPTGNPHLMQAIWSLAALFVDLRSFQYIIVYENAFTWSTRANDLHEHMSWSLHGAWCELYVALQQIVNKNVIFYILWHWKGGGCSLVGVKETVPVNNSSKSLHIPYALVYLSQWIIERNLGCSSNLCCSTPCSSALKQLKHTEHI